MPCPLSSLLLSDTIKYIWSLFASLFYGRTVWCHPPDSELLVESANFALYYISIA